MVNVEESSVFVNVCPAATSSDQPISFRFAVMKSVMVFVANLPPGSSTYSFSTYLRTRLEGVVTLPVTKSVTGLYDPPITKSNAPAD